MRRALAFARTALALCAALGFAATGLRPAEAQSSDQALPVNAIMVPYYPAGPRIIHVPQPGERPARASVPEREELYLDDDGDTYVPPRRSRVEPKPQKRAAVPPAEPRRKPFNPPPQQRRAILSAPPPSPDTSLTPIRPTPRFDKKPETGEKFATSPPPGYTPPKALPEPPKPESPAPATDESPEPPPSE